MHPADIKAALEKAGLSQTTLATRVARAGGRHVNRSAVCRVINGSLKSAGIAKAVSDAIGRKVGEVFPGRYPRLEFVEALLPKTAAPVPSLKPARKKAVVA